MLFNSWVFVAFLLPVYLLYGRLSHRGQNLLLLGASYVFYGWWDWRFLLLVWVSTGVDYWVGRRLGSCQDPARRRRLLCVNMVVNLGLLGFFKYFHFFLDSAGALLAGLGLAGLGRGLEIVLPVGISFYTFQTMSYTLDVYRRRQEPVADPVDFALFVAFFPQLVAGPIERAGALLPQLQGPRRSTQDDLVVGAWLIFWGLLKKVVVADNLAPYVDGVFGAVGEASRLEVVLATYAFAYQIYGDFSGYSDVARGLARLLGVELTVNFDIPYLAQGPSEFWRRWHITLSRWLRDYLYIPLGGNRGGPAATTRNLMVTMVLGGLWHGAAWNFVAWGAYHGALLGLYRVLRGDRESGVSWSGRALLRVVWFHLVCLGWVLFRAPGLGAAGTLLARLATGPWLSVAAVGMLPATVALVGLLWGVEALVGNADDPRTRPGWDRFGPPLVAGLGILFLFLAPPAQRFFIYFQF